MSDKFLLTIRSGNFDFGSPFKKAQFVDWMKKNEGATVEVVPRKRVKQKKRGYFYGALIPAFCDWHEKLDPDNPRHCNFAAELLLTEFAGDWSEGLQGQPVKIRRSTSTFTDREYGEVIDKVVRWFEENEIPVPDAELYKQWRDSAPAAGDRFWDYLQRNGLRVDGSPKELAAAK